MEVLLSLNFKYSFYFLYQIFDCFSSQIFTLGIYLTKHKKDFTFFSDQNQYFIWANFLYFYDLYDLLLAYFRLKLHLEIQTQLVRLDIKFYAKLSAFLVIFLILLAHQVFIGTISAFNKSLKFIFRLKLTFGTWGFGYLLKDCLWVEHFYMFSVYHHTNLINLLLQFKMHKLRNLWIKAK